MEDELFNFDEFKNPVVSIDGILYQFNEGRPITVFRYSRNIFSKLVVKI